MSLSPPPLSNALADTNRWTFDLYQELLRTGVITAANSSQLTDANGNITGLTSSVSGITTSINNLNTSVSTINTTLTTVQADLALELDPTSTDATRNKRVSNNDGKTWYDHVNDSDGVHGLSGNVVGTTDTQTLTNKTISGVNNTVSGLTHGSQVDNPSSGVHGVTGSVVGTSDTQTLTNKTLTTPIVNSQTIPTTLGLAGTIHTNSVAVSNTVFTEENLMSYAMPANILATNGDVLEITVWGTTGATANNKTLRFYLGATTVIDTGAVAANNQDFYFHLWVIRLGAASQEIILDFRASGAFTNVLNTIAATEDLTATVTIRLTAECPTAASDATQKGFIVKWLPSK